MQRYFMLKDYPEVDSESILVEGEPFHHMTRVMRMKNGGKAYLVFNQQEVIMAEITEIAEQHLIMKELQKIERTTELPVQVTLYCGFPKGDKLELIVQKSTELGASQIVGFPSKTSIVKWNDKKRVAKEERLTKIAMEAAEQSHRNIFPKVRLLGEFATMTKELSEFDYVLVAFEESAKKGEHAQLVETLKEIKQGESIAFIFGPEGGLTEDEVKTFESLGAKVCALGPRILRTETAPFYALSAVSYQMEMLGK